MNTATSSFEPVRMETSAAKDGRAAPTPAAKLELGVGYVWPKELLDWKELPGAGLVMQAYYKYADWDFRRWRDEGVRSSARFIEERVRDDIRCGKQRGIELDGYTLNSHLTKPILMHMLAEHPEWRVMYEVRAAGSPGGRLVETNEER